MYYNDKDISYITKDNYKQIIDRIDYVINNPYTRNTNTPKDLIDLIELKNHIYRKFRGDLFGLD